jgi:hypothetical protein
MSGTRRAIIKLTLIVLATSALAPALASAGSLLSGYGGPGEGNQAILGSALLNGRSGKGGSGGSGNAAATAPSGSYSLIASREGQGVSASHGSGGFTGSSSARSSKSGGKQKHVHAGAEKASNRASQPYTQTNRSSTETSAGGSQPLGLSGADLLYILLALVVLAFTGVLTRGLVRANMHGDGGSAQAMRRRTRLTN